MWQVQVTKEKICAVTCNVEYHVSNLMWAISCSTQHISNQYYHGQRTRGNSPTFYIFSIRIRFSPYKLILCGPLDLIAFLCPSWLWTHHVKPLMTIMDTNTIALNPFHIIIQHIRLCHVMSCDIMWCSLLSLTVDWDDVTAVAVAITVNTPLLGTTMRHIITMATW